MLTLGFENVTVGVSSPLRMVTVAALEAGYRTALSGLRSLRPTLHDRQRNHFITKTGHIFCRYIQDDTGHSL